MAMNVAALALLGGAAYLLLKSQQSAAPAPAATPTTIPPVNPVVPAPASTGTGRGTGAPRITKPAGITTAQVYQALVASLQQNVPAYAQNPSTFTGTPYGFLYWVNQNPAVPSYDQLVAAGLNFDQMFGNSGNTPITLAQFWAKMAPWFQTSLGMSGLAWMPQFNPMLVPRFMARSWGRGYVN